MRASPLLSIHNITWNLQLSILKNLMMFTCVNLDGTLLLFQCFYTTVYLPQAYLNLSLLIFTSVGQRAVLFACVLLENNMPDIHCFKLTLTWFEFILISISVAAWTVFLYRVSSNNQTCLVKKMWFHLLTAQSPWFPLWPYALILFSVVLTVLCSLPVWKCTICLSSKNIAPYFSWYAK